MAKDNVYLVRKKKGNTNPYVITGKSIPNARNNFLGKVLPSKFRKGVDIKKLKKDFKKDWKIEKAVSLNAKKRVSRKAWGGFFPTRRSRR